MGTRKFYKTTKDAITDVGISARQLNYWRDHGLVKNELRDPRTFTAKDLAWLRFIKLLIVDYGLSPQAAQKLLQRVEHAGGLTEHGQARTLLDLPTSTLLSPREALRRHLTGAFWDEPLDNLEQYLLGLTIVWLMKVRKQTRSPEVYRARRDSFLTELQQLEVASRVQHRVRYLSSDEVSSFLHIKHRPPVNPEESWTIEPSLEDDEKHSPSYHLTVDDEPGFSQTDFRNLSERLRALLAPLGLPMPPDEVIGSPNDMLSDLDDFEDVDLNDVPF